MKSVLIIGITGQDGTCLARHLLTLGYRVRGTSRRPAADLPALRGLELLTFDPAAPPAAWEVLLKKCAPAEIYHLAGQSSVGLSLISPAETFTANATGVVNLLEAVRRLELKTRICLASSGECFGDTGGVAADEQTPMRPRNPYAAAKVAAFWQADVYRRIYGLFVASAFLYNHESPLRSAGFVTAKVIAGALEIAAGRPRRLELGNLDIVRDWGWAPEYVQALHLMLQHPRPEDFIIASGRSYSLQDFVAHAFTALGLNWREHVEHNPALVRPGDIPVCRANPAKAADLLGWRAATTMPGVVERLLKGKGV